jgi:hypothetical protein
MKFYEDLHLEEFTTVLIKYVRMDIVLTLFQGQIPSYKASNWGFSFFMRIFNFSINSYLLVYELNQKSGDK